MKYEHIIWDFNGTILDDVETGIMSVNKLLRDRGLPEIQSKDHYRRIFRFPIKEYYQSLGFDFSKEPYEVIAPLWVEQYMENVKTAKMFDDVEYALAFFREKGIKQTVLSATEESMLKMQLEDLGIIGYFDEVLGLDNIHASSKQRLATEWRNRHPKEKAVMLGDTDHDFEVARSMDVECALICRGHQSKEYLLSFSSNIYHDILQFCLDMN